jgi:fructosamine-3-kinase
MAAPPAPPPAVIAWIERIGGTSVTAIDVLPQTRVTGPWLLQCGDERRVVKLGDDRVEAVRREFRTAAEALTVAEAHGVLAPRLLAADLDGADAGCLVLLQSALEGTSGIPREPALARSLAFGRAIAAIHAVRLEPSDALPRRTRSLESVDFESFDVPPADAALFEAVRLATATTPPGAATATSLVHGDLWQGNTLWTGPTELSGTIDWDGAGVGHPGIDLGTTRFDAAVFHGLDHADALLEGWRAASNGAAPGDLPYWDLLAVRCSPPDLAAWLPNFHQQGRTDLDLATVTGRREAFVEAALREAGK